MNYRELLKKYITHVGMEEGTTFIGVAGKPFTMNEEEWAELRAIDAEAFDRGKKEK